MAMIESPVVFMVVADIERMFVIVGQVADVGRAVDPGDHGHRQLLGGEVLGGNECPERIGDGDELAVYTGVAVFAVVAAAIPFGTDRRRGRACGRGRRASSRRASRGHAGAWCERQQAR